LAILPELNHTERKLCVAWVFLLQSRLSKITAAQPVKRLRVIEVELLYV